MRDFLKEFCTLQKIQLVYNNNKYSLLSFGIQGNMPIMRVHRMFRYCPQDMANIIVNYYKYYQWQYSYIRAIQNYAAKINPMYSTNQCSMIRNTLQIKPNNSSTLSNQGYNIDRIQNENLDMLIESKDMAVIHGIVKLPDGTPANGALVKLYKKGFKPYQLIPVTFTFTDEFGQFSFEAESEIDLVIKVFYYEAEKKSYCISNNYVYYE